MGFRFEHPLFAALFLALPILAWLFSRRQERAPYRFSSLLLPRFALQALGSSWRARLRWLDTIVWVAGLSLAILALMRPQWGSETSENTQEGIAIMLAIDTSRSMAALDFKLGDAETAETDRLTVVKAVVKDFIDKRVSDQIGMVVFGELAFTQCPLTHDRGVLLGFVDRLELGMAGDGTAIGDGIAVATKRLKDAKPKSKVMILLTDGESNAGRFSPLQAAGLAKDLGVKIYTIGIGSKGKVPFPEQTPWGVRIVMADLGFDEQTLMQIAEETGGNYWNAKNTRELTEIYGLIDRMEKTEIKVKRRADYRELYDRFLVPALVLLGLFPLVRLFGLKRWVGF